LVAVVGAVEMSEHLLTARELGEQLGFSAGTIVDWAEAGKIPSFKIGGRLRFRQSEVEAWLEERRQGPSPTLEPLEVA
jgi:excisionase family DNA binding protein